MVKTIRDFIEFIKHPVLLEPDVLSFWESVKLILKGVLFYTFITLIYGVFTIVLLSWAGLQLPGVLAPKISEMYKVVIIAPIAEELIFRLPLRNLFKNIFVAFGLFAYIIAKKFFILPLAIFLGLIVIVIPYLPNIARKAESKINYFVNRRYGYVFYLFVFLFGLTHLLNLEYFNSKMFLPTLIYVFNPLIVGILFAFIRVKYKYGIYYAIILHALTNLLHFVPALLFR